MKTVNISDAKNNLSRHLEYVRRGGRVRILDRNTPVAELVPIEPGAEPADDEELLADPELLRQVGLVEPDGAYVSSLVSYHRIRGPEASP